MDFTKLVSLIGITKKAEAAMAKKYEFQKELFNLLNEENYSEVVEKYIFEGFQLGSPASYVEFLKTKSDPDKEQSFHDFTSGSLFYKNEKGITFKIMTALLGHMINEKTFSVIIEDIIRRLNGLSRNKENKRIGDFSRTIEKYLVNVLNPDVELPEISKMNLTPIALEKFKELINEALSELKISDPKCQVTVKKIKQWLGDTNGDTIEIEKKDLEIQKNESATAKDDIDNISKSQQLLFIADYLRKLESDYEKLKKSNDTIRRSYSEKIDQLSRDNENLKKTVKEASDHRDTLNRELVLMKNELERKTAEIDRLKNEIQRRNAVLNVYESDKLNSQQEQLNSIASKLRVEYKDFQDATDMDMTVDLGENMRQQLSSIFKTLIKNGINLERR